MIENSCGDCMAFQLCKKLRATNKYGGNVLSSDYSFAKCLRFYKATFRMLIISQLFLSKFSDIGSANLGHLKNIKRASIIKI